MAGVLVVPAIAFAQNSSRVHRIGVLEFGDTSPEWLRRREEPLRELGWVEGKNLVVERRYDNGHPEALHRLAEELVRAHVEIIVTQGTTATLAAKRATTTIPIVFESAGDPVLLGLVASLAEPGGNVTGFSGANPEVTAKYLSLLKELLPRTERVAFLEIPANPYYRATRGQFQHVCQALGLDAVFVEVAKASEIDAVIAHVVLQRANVLVLPSENFVSDHQFEIVDAATKHRLPIMAEDPALVREAGALFSYNAVGDEQARVRAYYIDRILRGAKPADLPVRQPTMFELLINLKTAKALGLTIPKDLLMRADEVIQ